MTVLAPYSADRATSTPVCIAINNSTLSGLLDLQGAKIATLSLGGVLIPDGRVNLATEQLLASGDFSAHRVTTRKAVRRVLDLGLRCSGDEMGILAAEQFLCDRLTSIPSEPNPNKELDRHEALYLDVAEQYGELRNAFSRVASGSEQEGLCHYKYKDYSRCARTANMREGRIWPAIRPWAIGLPALLLITILILVIGPWVSLFLWAPLLLMYVLGACNHPFTALRVVEVSFDKIIWKHFLGYGMYARRVVTSAAWMICFFALCYGMCDRFWSRTLGSVESVDGHLTGSSTEPYGIVETTQNCLYYSVVTFSTLGYGDYAPKGPVRLLAATEALLGGVFIAFLTVVFARKFIR